MESLMQVEMLSFIGKLPSGAHGLFPAERAAAFMGRSGKGICYFLPDTDQIVATCPQLSASQAGKCRDYTWSVV